MAITLIDGGTFNFTELGYTPPTWSGGTYNFSSEGYLRQIWTDENYVYAATTVGLRLVDIDSELEYAFIDYSDGFTSVWANDNYVYIGTTSSGVKRVAKTCISGSTASAYDLTHCLRDYKSSPQITSDNTRYVHGNGNKIIICTDDGVDVFDDTGSTEIYSYKVFDAETEARKGFMCSDGSFYYLSVTVSGATYSGIDQWEPYQWIDDPDLQWSVLVLTSSGTEYWYLNRVDDYRYDWTTPDKVYYPADEIFSAGLEFKDIFATTGTSVSGINNTLFVATTSGVYIIDEETQETKIFYTT